MVQAVLEIVVRAVRLVTVLFLNIAHQVVWVVSTVVEVNALRIVQVTVYQVVVKVLAQGLVKVVAAQVVLEIVLHHVLHHVV